MKRTGGTAGRLAGAMAAGMLLTAPSALAQDAQGKWTGAVKAPGQDIPLVLTVTKAADGTLTASMESPSQAPGMVIPLDSITVANGEMTFAMAQILGDYKGKWNADTKIWDGTWTQDGTAMELDLAKAQ